MALAAAVLGLPLIVRDAVVLNGCKGKINSCAAASGLSVLPSELKRSALVHLVLSVAGLALVAGVAYKGKADTAKSLVTLMILFFGGSAIWNLAGTNDLTCSQSCSSGAKFNADGSISKYGTNEIVAISMNSITVGLLLLSLGMFVWKGK